MLAAAICAALAARGERVAAFKPAVTGLDDAPGEWPRDHELLAGRRPAQSPGEVAPYALRPAGVAPLGGRAGGHDDRAGAARRARARGRIGADALVCEGVGGLLVPLTTGYSVRDLAVDLGLPVWSPRAPASGTINHTLLTVEAARAAGLQVAGVVMTPWPAEPAPIEVSNRATVERLAGVAVSGLPPTAPGDLAAAGAGLPLDDWL